MSPMEAPAFTRSMVIGIANSGGRIAPEWIPALEEALAAGDRQHAQEEVGDLLFAVTNLARTLGADPEQCLRNTNTKFERRFR